ncbi:MAG: threonine/serine exporter family protein [Anaerovoracaceae bacterium]
MINILQKKALILAVRAGEIMLKSGAEIYRVEDTIERICKACGISYVEVFATPTGLFVSVDNGDDNSDVYTYVKRIRSGADTNLEKISQINHFSREFTTTDLSIDQGMKRMKAIDKHKLHPMPIRLLGAALIASCFAQLFGGNVLDICCAFVIGGASYIVSLILRKFEINYFIRAFCCCAISAFCALLCTEVIATTNYNAIIIGSIMIFVPGVAITNSIRDFLSGDMLSGIARLTEAFIIAIALATGAGVILKIWGSIGGIII